MVGILSLNQFRAWGYFRLGSVTDFRCCVGKCGAYQNVHGHTLFHLHETFKA